MNKKIVLFIVMGIFVTCALFAVVGFAMHSPSGSRPAESTPVLAAANAAPPAQAAAPAAAPASPAPASVETDAWKKLFDKRDPEHAVMHKVARGETLTKISKQYGVTVGLLKKVNALTSDGLNAGQTLKVPAYKLSAVVDKSQNTMLLKGDEVILKTYAVSTGKDNSTPVGTFKTTTKLVNPTWYTNGRAIKFGDPEHQLGTRWIGIDKKGYGIHGTIEPDQIGRQVTAGCVRLRNEEVEELYDIFPQGAEVTIVD